MIQKLLEEDPEIKKDLEKLQQELDGYVGEQGLQVPDDGRSPRRQEDFDDLDYEMITQMNARNHALVKWRYGLGALCLFLLCLCGFLFRLSENNHSSLLVEKAEHAQDETSHHLELKHALENIPEWHKIATRKIVASNGLVLLHKLENQHVLLLDLSHCDTISSGHAYHVFFDGEFEEAPELVISAEGRVGLHPVVLEKETGSVQIFISEVDSAPPTNDGDKMLVADISIR